MKKAYLFLLLFFKLSLSFAQVGTLTGTGMSICNLYSFSVCPTQTITPLNYGSQGYACSNTTQPDVSFNIQGSSWRVMKYNWFFSATVAGQVRGYDNTGALQSFTFAATNTITPLSYSGTYVQFAINGTSTGPLMSQANFSISVTPVLFGNATFTYCASTATSVAISPTVPAQGGPWTYSWQPGGLTGNPVNVSPTANTVYTVTAKTTAGCTSTAAVTVNINCPPPPPICSGNSGAPVFLEDFGSGTTLYGPALPAGVTTYPYITGPPPNGSYVLSSQTDPSGVTGFAGDYLIATGDHTGNPNGYMMVINSDYAASEVYRKHVTGLCPNTTYVFSAYLANNDDPGVQGPVCGSSYIFANVKFKVEYPVGTVQGSTSTGNLPLSSSGNVINWVHSGFVFTTGPAQTSADVVMANNAPGGCGNDFVVDDISLSTCGPAMNVSISPNQQVFCPGSPVTLQANYTSGSYVSPQYQWQYSNNGGVTWTNISGANGSSYSITAVSPSQAGSYQVVVAENGNINSPSCSILAGPVTFSVGAGAMAVNSATICGIQSATLTATGAASYTWSTGATTPSIVVSPASSAQYTVTGTAGTCTNQAIASVSVSPSPTVSAGMAPNTPLCSGSSATLTATGANSYSWTNAATLSSSSASVVVASPTVTTTYSISGTSAACTSTAAITVTVNPSPGITSASVSNAFCGSSNGSATLSTSPAGNSYTWSAGAASAGNSATGLAAGNYTVLIANGSCQTSTVLTVANSGTLSITSVTITPSVCGSAVGSISVTANIANSTYSWTPSAGTSTNSLSGLTAGNYSLSISNGSCQTSTVITVPNNSTLTVTGVTITPSICGAAVGSLSVTTNMANSTYSWMPSSGASTNSLSGLAPGSYSLTVTNASCQTSTVLTVPSGGTVSVTSVTVTPSACDHASGAISVSDNMSNSTYSWTPSAGTSTNSISSLAPGNYSLSITNGSCHTATVIPVGLATGPTALGITKTNAICGQPDAVITVTNVVNGAAPYQYSFNSGAYSAVASDNGLLQGTYTVSVKDANGCAYSQTVIITRADISFQVHVTTAAPHCETHVGAFTVDSISGGAKPYVVNLDNGLFLPNMTFNNITPGTYTLTVMDSNQCVNGYLLVMPEDDGDYTLYIPNTFTPNKDGVNELWHAYGTCLGDYHCIIYNRWGEKVKESTNIEDGWDGTFMGQAVPDGIYVYLLEVQTKKGPVKKTGHITLFR